MGSSRSLRILASLAFLAAPAATAGQAPAKPFDLTAPGGLEQQAANVRAGMQPGGAYDFVTPQARAEVESRITDIKAVLQREHDGQAVDKADLVTVLNDQAAINRILTRGQRGAYECAWAAPTGSHISRAVCWYATL